MENKKKVIVSAPGKIHLMGEHAVVWGRPALLSAINLRLYVTVSPTSDRLLIVSEETDVLIKKTVEIIKKRLKLISDPPVKIEINSQIPAGRHLGSSAALAVGVCAALVYFLKQIWNPSLFNQLAYEAEKFQHKNPSGGDNSIVCFGGLVYFRKEFEFLKSIWQLPFKSSLNSLPFILIDTGRPSETTGEMVELVGKFIKKYPEKARRLLDQNEEAVKEITISLKEGNKEGLKKAMMKGERTLEGLGVVSKKAVSLIREIEKIGGAAKILGGGGRKENVGFLLVFNQERDKIEKIAARYSCRLYSVKVGEEGVRLENGKK